MKEDEVRTDYEPHQMLLYAEKADGSFGTVRTGSYMSKNHLDDLLEKRDRLRALEEDRLTRGEISPVAYYMALCDMTVADLARRVGLWPFTVRRHLLPRYFRTMRLEAALRYAEVFGIPLANLFQVLAPPPAGFALKQTATGNPAVVMTRLVPGDATP